MAGGEPEKGDKVSWNWGGGKPGGTVAEKKTEGEVAITSKRGNKIKKNAEPSDPAVHVERSGNDVVKKASELNVEKKASGGGGGGDKKSDDKEKNAGEKRKAEDDKKEGGDEPLTVNKEGKEVKPGGNKKAKKDEPKKDEKKEEEKKKDEKKEDEKKKDEKKDEDKAKADAQPNGDKAAPKKAGRPKKAEGASSSSSKKKKEPTPRSTEGIGSRTRSRG